MSISRASIEQDLGSGESEQVVEMFGGEAKAAVLGRDGVEKSLPCGRRQAVVQRAAAMRIDVDAVALEPIGACPGVLIDVDRYSSTVQALCEAQAADASTPIVPGEQETSATVSVTFSLR